MDQKLIAAALVISNLKQMHNALSIQFLTQQKRLLKHLQRLLREKKIQEITMIYSLRYFLRSPRRIYVKNRRKGWFRHLLEHRDEEDWFESFHMKKETFRYICELLTPTLEPKPNALSSQRAISTEEQVAIGIYYLGCSAELRVIGEVFGYAKSTIWKCVRRVCQAIVDILLPLWIRMPNEEECETLSLLFAMKTGIPQIIGAIDGSHIPITPPADGQSDFINRKGWPSINLQGLVDYDLLIRNIKCENPGSCHDAFVFTSSNLYNYHDQVVPQKTEEVHGVRVPYLIIGDPAYPLSNWLIKNYPFTSAITEEQDSFNAYLNKGRVVVEMVFGRLKGRWRRLTKRLEVDVTFAPIIISACCVLHNIVESKKEDFPEEWLDFVTASGATFPQPGPQQCIAPYNAAADEQPDRDGEKVRNALLEVTKTLPLLKSIHWQLSKY